VAAARILAALFLAGPCLQGGAHAQSMRVEVYEKLSEAEKAAEAGDFEKAFDELEQAEKTRDLSEYEKAQIYTASGFVHYSREDYPASIRSYEKILELEGLTEALELGTVYTLAQLHLQTEDYGGAAGYLERWLGSTETAGPEPYILLAQAYYQMERYGDALERIRTAVGIAESAGRKVEESWYGLLRAVYFELQDYPKVVEVLEILVTRYPRKDYWVQLAAMYQQTGSDRKQLAAYEVAHVEGYLQRKEELLRYAQLLLQAKVPYRAGVILRDGIEKGVIDASEENYRLLSQAWTLAREDADAIVALREAASLADDGELDARLAQAHLNLGEWEEAVSAARVALQKGVDGADEVQLVLGMALYGLDRYDDARSAFRLAESSGKSAALAAQWIRAIDSEQERLNELQRATTP
jgi:tetratricopeptide (TPR) repeat protein